MNERNKEIAEEVYGIDESKPFHPAALHHLLLYAEKIREDEASAAAKHFLAIVRDSVNHAVLREREACAKLCYELDNNYMNSGINGYGRPDGRDCAEAIRQRGEQP
jgi:hypothetical protein